MKYTYDTEATTNIIVRGFSRNFGGLSISWEYLISLLLKISEFQ